MAHSPADGDAPGSRALDRGLSILGLFADGQREWTVREICDHLKIPVATGYRLVRTLTEHGFLRAARGSRTHLELGLEVLRLASAATEGSDLQSAMAPVLRELVSVTGETAVLLVPGGDQAVCVRVVEGTSPIRPRSARVGERIPYNGGATPMAIFAHLSEAERLRLTQAGLESFASQTLVEREQIEETCAVIRRNGYAHSTSEYIEGTAAVAAPVFDRDGRVQGAIGVTGIASRIHGFEQIIRDAGAEGTLRVGGVAPVVIERDVKLR